MIMYTAQGTAVCSSDKCDTVIDVGDKVLEHGGRLFCCRECYDQWTEAVELRHKLESIATDAAYAAKQLRLGCVSRAVDALERICEALKGD